MKDEIIVTLTTEDNSQIEFLEAYQTIYKNKMYSILLLKTPKEGLNVGDAFVFLVNVDELGNETYECIDNEEIIDYIFTEYENSIEE